MSTPPIRIGGLASGLDTGDIIKQLIELRAERIEVVKEQKISFQADVAAWMEVNSYMSTLTDVAYRLRSVNTWNAMLATSSDETKLTATATRTAIDSTYTIGFNQLATAHSVASDQHAASTNLVGTVLTGGDTFTITGDPAGTPQTITIDSTEETLISLAGKINDAALSMDEEHRVFAQIIDDQLVITRSNTGTTEIQMANTLGTPLSDLGIGTTVSYTNVWVAAKDAEFTVNGSGVITRSSNTNITDVISGIALNLSAGSGSAMLTVRPDSENVKEAILDFVTSYNQVTETFKKHTGVDLSDPRNPITGQLQGDTLARSIPARMRQLVTSINSSMTDANASYIYNGSNGILNSLHDIGVWTSGTGAYSAENTLAVIEEDRLDYMLSNYFEEVEQLFMGVTGSDEKGMGRTFYDYSYKVSSDLTGDIDVKKSGLTDQIYRKDQQIEKMFDDLENYENRLWRDFRAMEDAVARMQQDLGWLVQELGVQNRKS